MMYILFFTSFASNLYPQTFPKSTTASSSSSNTLFFFCGNFGVLLINSSWINIDGGKKALDMLEKMVEVTMMRGKFELVYVL